MIVICLYISDPSFVRSGPCHISGGIHRLENNRDGIVTYNKCFYSPYKADIIFNELMAMLDFEGQLKQPRLCAWFGSVQYSYSNVTHKPQCFKKNKVLSFIKKDVEHHYQTEFNSCLINLYRDGQDSVGWHADDETSLGYKPTIASISFGEMRRFELCRKNDVRKMPVYYFTLENGSALLMKGDIQERWLHRVPKEFDERRARLNLTFRNISA